MDQQSAPSGSKRFSDLPDADAPCEGCRYNLRGQPLDGRCPECGTAVAVSAAKVADRYAGMVAVGGQNNERRRSDLRWGPWLILTGAACWGLTALLPSGSDMILPRNVVQVASWTLAGAGVFVSVRWPRGEVQTPWMWWLSFIARAAAIICVIAPVLTIMSLESPKIAGMPFYNRSTADVLGGTARWAGMLGTIAFFLYARHVAQAAGHRVVANASLIVTLVLGLGFLWTLIPVLFHRGNTFRLYAANGMLDSPLVGTAINMASGDTWRNMLYFPSLQFSSILLPKLMRAIFTGNAWWSVLILLQLALMSGRSAPAGSAENTEASSRP